LNTRYNSCKADKACLTDEINRAKQIFTNLQQVNSNLVVQSDDLLAAKIASDNAAETAMSKLYDCLNDKCNKRGQ
jgi:hypothetical protein